MKPAAIALALIVTSTLPAAAQEWVGRGRLQGTVKNEAGKPVEGARVLLRYGQTETGPDEMQTNAKGRWSMLGLAHGDWIVLVDAEGYVGASGSIRVYESGPGQSLEIELRRPTPEEIAQAQASQQSGALDNIEKGNALVGEQRYGEARTEYEAALADLLPQNHPPVLRAIANTWYAEGDVDQAVATFDRALALVPDDPELLQSVVNVLVASGREAEAQVYLARLPADAELNPATLLNFGIEAYNAGKMDEAFEHFDRLVKQDPGNADGYYYRGIVFLNRGDNAAAAADLKKLLEIAPDHPKAAEAKDFLAYLEP